MNRNNGNNSSKFANSNLNAVYQKPTPSNKNAGGQRHGMLLLGNKTTRARAAPGASKLAVPKPVNLPSIKKEHAGNDPTTQLVPTGGSGGGWKTDDLKDPLVGNKQSPSQIPPPGSDVKPLAAGSTWGSALSARAPTPAEAANAVPYAAYGPASRSSRGPAERLNPAEYPTLGTAASQPARPSTAPQSHLPQRDDRHWDDDERASGPRPHGGHGDWYRRDAEHDRYEDERHIGRGPPVGGRAGAEADDYGIRGPPPSSYSPRVPTGSFGPSALLGDNAPFERRAPYADDDAAYYGRPGSYGRSSLVDEWKPSGGQQQPPSDRYGTDEYGMPIPGRGAYGKGQGPGYGKGSPPKQEKLSEEREEVDLAREAYKAEVEMVARMQEEEREKRLQDEKTGKKGGAPPPPAGEEPKEAPPEPEPEPEPEPVAKHPEPEAPVNTVSPPASMMPPRQSAVPPGARLNTTPASLDAITASSALVSNSNSRGPSERGSEERDESGEVAERKPGGPRLGALKPRSNDAEAKRKALETEEEERKAKAKLKLEELEKRMAARRAAQAAEKAEDEAAAPTEKGSALLERTSEENVAGSEPAPAQVSGPLTGSSWRNPSEARPPPPGMPAPTEGPKSVKPADGSEDVLETGSVPAVAVPASAPPNAWGAASPPGARQSLEAWGASEGSNQGGGFSDSGAAMNPPPGMPTLTENGSAAPSEVAAAAPHSQPMEAMSMAPQTMPGGPASFVPPLGPLFNVPQDPVFAPLASSDASLRAGSDMPGPPANLNSGVALNLGPMNQVIISAAQHQQSSYNMAQGVPPGVMQGGRPAWQDGPGAMFTGGPLGGMILPPAMPPHPGMPGAPYGTGMPGFQPQHMGLGGMPGFNAPDGMLHQGSAVGEGAPTFPPGMSAVANQAEADEMDAMDGSSGKSKKGGKGKSKDEDKEGKSKDKGRKGRDAEAAVAGTDESRGKGRGKGASSPVEGKKEPATAAAVVAGGKGTKGKEAAKGKGSKGKGEATSKGKGAMAYRAKVEGSAEEEEGEVAGEGISDTWPESDEFVEVRSKKAVQTEKREQQQQRAATAAKDVAKGAKAAPAKGDRKTPEPAAAAADPAKGGKGKRGEARNPGLPKSPTLSGEPGPLPGSMDASGAIAGAMPGMSSASPPGLGGLGTAPPGLGLDAVPGIHPWRTDQAVPSLAQMQLEESRAAARSEVLAADLLPATLETSPDKKEVGMLKEKAGGPGGDMLGNGPNRGAADNLPADLSLGDMPAGPTRMPLPAQMPYGFSGPIPPPIPPMSMGFPQFDSSMGMAPQPGDMGSGAGWVPSQPGVTSGQDSFYATPAAFRSTFGAPPQQQFVPQAFPGQLGSGGQLFGMPYNQFGGMSSFSYLPTGKQPDWKHTPSSSTTENSGSSFGVDPQMQMQRSVNEAQWGQSFGGIPLQMPPPGLGPGGPGPALGFDPAQGNYAMGVMASQQSNSQGLSQNPGGMVPGGGLSGGRAGQRPAPQQPPQFPDELGAGFIESMGTMEPSAPASSQPQSQGLQGSGASAGGSAGPSGQGAAGRRGKGSRGSRGSGKGMPGKGKGGEDGGSKGGAGKGGRRGPGSASGAEAGSGKAWSGGNKPFAQRKAHAAASES